MSKQGLELVTPREGDRAAEIISLHNEIKGHLQSSLEKALRLGGLLVEQKQSLEHGQFTPWIESSLPFSARTARVYMKVYNQRDKLKTEGAAVLSDALKSLRRPPALPQGKLEGEGERTSIAFSVTAEQRSSIELGLDEVKELLETRSTGKALEYICQEYMAYSHPDSGGR